MPSPKKNDKTDAAKVKKTAPDGVIRFEVDDVSALKECDYLYSPTVEVKGVPWRMEVSHLDSALTVELTSVHTQLAPWKADVCTECTLLNHNDKKSVITEESKEMLLTNMNYFYSTFTNIAKWEEIIDENKGFIKNGKITVEIRFWVSKMKGIRTFPCVDFTNPNEPRHDITFVIEGEKIYTSKQFLALHSPVFHAMFNDDFEERDKAEIELKDVNREEFLEMLRVIYPSSKKIREDSVEYLLELGDRFQIVCLMDRAEKFLTDVYDFYFSDAQKLRIADKYRLYGLMEHCISAIDKPVGFKTIQESDIYSELSDGTKAALFERLVKIANDK